MVFIKKYISLLFLIFIVTSSFGQPGGGDPPGNGEPVPITGLELLFAAGALFGSHRLIKKKLINKS
jgi:hypothetical protein